MSNIHILERKTLSDKEGKLEIVPKDDIKVMLGRSPDYGDALMMRMVFELERGLPRADKSDLEFARLMKAKQQKSGAKMLRMA